MLLEILFRENQSNLVVDPTQEVLVHLVDLPADLVLQLLHLLVLHLVHLHAHHLLKNANHFPNNLQKQYYHHRQQLRP